jgi:hypothetical protein
MLERDSSDLFRVGRRSLAIGIAVLAVCTGLSQILRTTVPSSALAQLVAEGILIFGWVANWRPAEIFLYDIWAVRRRIRLYRRLAQARIEDLELLTASAPASTRCDQAAFVREGKFVGLRMRLDQVAGRLRISFRPGKEERVFTLCFLRAIQLLWINCPALSLLPRCCQLCGQCPKSSQCRSISA